MKVEVGSVVVLKSGSPQMTVSDIDDDQATCIWYNDDKMVERTFPLAVLVVEGE